MRSSDLLPPLETARGRYVLVPGGPDAPTVELRADGWTRVELPDLAADERPVLVVPVGRGGSVIDVLPLLEELRPSALVVLADEPANDRAVERAVVRLAAYGNTVTRVEDLDDGSLLAGIVLEASGDEGGDAPAAASREARRRLEELRVGTDAAAGRSVEALRRRLRAAERARSREASRATQFEQELRQATRELALERRRLTQLERSTSYRLGQAVVQTVRDPRQAGKHSRELLDRWRKRGSGSTASSPVASAAATTGDLATSSLRPPIVTTVPAVAVPGRRNAVAAIVSDRTAAALDGEVLLTRLLPHDAVDLIGAVAPQVVVIESAACLPGGPWAGAGSGAVPARDRELAAVVDAADRAGAATVLVWSGARWEAPGLAALAARCTLEVAADDEGFDWVLGIPPAQVHRAAADRAADLAVVEARGTVRVPTAYSALITRIGPELGGPLAADPWGVWSRHDAWLVPVVGPDRWQLTAAAAAGATPVAATTLALPDWAQERGAVVAGRSETSWVSPTWRQRCRAVLDGSTSASLRALGGLLGREIVAGTSRSVALRVARADEAHVDAALRQRDLPRGSVVVTPGPLPDRAVGALEAADLRVATYLPSSARFLADLDVDRHGAEHLSVLLAGWELTRAAVVGLADGEPLRAGRADDVDPRDLLVERERLAGDAVTADTPAVLVPPTEVPA